MDPDTAPFGRWNRAGLLMLKGGARQDREPPNGAVPSQNLRVLARSAGKFDRPVGEGIVAGLVFGGRANPGQILRRLPAQQRGGTNGDWADAVEEIVRCWEALHRRRFGKCDLVETGCGEGVAAFLDVAETKGRGRVAVLHPCCRTAPLRT